MDNASVPGQGPVDTTQSPHARLRTLPLGDVRFTEGFWLDRQETNREISLPLGYQMLEKSGNMQDLRLVSGAAKGKYQGPVFMDSDVHKWLEAAGFELARRDDTALQGMADSLTSLLESAQGADGYLDSYWQVVEPDRRWADLSHGHELYCLGHLTQAAVAFHRATGQTRLLNVARRFADYVDSVFGPGKRPGTPGHPEVETALVELYRDTGDERYLKLAGYFVDQRGYGMLGPGRHQSGSYYQDHIPVRRASEVDGHAVRALYLTSGVADIYLETGEKALFDALLRQWDDMTLRKMYVTGGVGSRHYGESFGDPYELPNDHAYCETCAAIASIMWNWRMLLATGEGRFADEAERALYNAVLSGISLDGRRYFYVNPLHSHGADSPLGRKTAQRAEWHSCACCPPNVMRLFASLGHYFTTRDGQGLQIHMYSDTRIATALSNGRQIGLTMTTDYPWDGKVTLVVDQADGSSWALSLRLPAWCESPTLSVNGERLAALDARDGYAKIERAWQVGDIVELDLPMTPRFVEAHPRVDPTRGSVAIARGPLVYCVEQADHDGIAQVLDVEVDETAPLTPTWRPDLLGGVVAIEAAGYAVDTSPWAGSLYQTLGAVGKMSRRPVRLTAIPYFAWANRTAGPMRVWIPRHGG